MNIFRIFFTVVTYPGRWLPYTVNYFHPLGDGTGNESSIIEFGMYTLFGAMILYTQSTDKYKRKPHNLNLSGTSRHSIRRVGD